MKMKKRSSISMLTICMGIALIMTGGFFDNSVAVIGISIIGSLLFMLLKGENFYKKDSRKVFMIPIALVCVAVLVSFWAVDYMENLLGAMRLGIVCLWMYLVRCRGKEEADEAKRMIPLMGCFTVCLSLISLCSSELAFYFWENNRLSGFFQYANTSGLFFAIGIIIIVYQLKEKKKFVYDIVQIAILLAGLLLSGSRSVLLLFLVWGAWYAVRTAEFRKPFLVGTSAVLLAGGLYVAVTGNTANVGRIFTIFTSNSTLWGRLLYYRDAVLFLCQKFFGLGRLGYYYTQGTFQSGVYSIKYVHNDFLQVALDYGVIALILLLVFCGWQVFKGKQSRADKELFVFVCVASLLDLHCQYLLIVMVLCLLLDYGNIVKENSSQRKIKSGALPVLLILFLYVGIATGSSRLGDYGTTLSMLPDYTYAQEEVLLNTMGTAGSYELANRLIEKNPYNITAYIVRGSFYGSQLYVRECINDFDKMLELAPYNVDYYRQYESLLEKMKEAMLAMGDEQNTEDLELLQHRLDSLPAQLEKVKDRTSSLAYKIKDQPEFSYK